MLTCFAEINIVRRRRGTERLMKNYGEFHDGHMKGKRPQFDCFPNRRRTCLCCCTARNVRIPPSPASYESAVGCVIWRAALTHVPLLKCIAWSLYCYLQLMHRCNRTFAWENMCWYTCNKVGADLTFSIFLRFFFWVLYLACLLFNFTLSSRLLPVAGVERLPRRNGVRLRPPVHRVLFAGAVGVDGETMQPRPRSGVRCLDMIILESAARMVLYCKTLCRVYSATPRQCIILLHKFCPSLVVLFGCVGLRVCV